MVRLSAATTPGAYFDFAISCFHVPMKGLLWASRTLDPSIARATTLTNDNIRFFIGSPFGITFDERRGLAGKNTAGII
jgi:hypothetical protein